MPLKCIHICHSFHFLFVHGLNLFFISLLKGYLVLLSVFDKNTNFWTKMRLFWNQKLIFSPVFRNFSSSRFLFQFVTPYIFSTFTGKLTGVDKFWCRSLWMVFGPPPLFTSRFFLFWRSFSLFTSTWAIADGAEPPKIAQISS